MDPASDTGKVARQFIQAWNVGHDHIIDDLAAPDLTVSYTHYPEPYHGPEAFKAMLSKTHRYFPDLTIAVQDILVERNRAVVRWTYQGTFREGEMFGVPASGQHVEVEGITIYVIEDGVVQREEGIVDNLALMQQLGIAPGRPDAE